jgi:hypothetical protein
VAKAIEQHELAAASERRDDSEIRHVPCGKQQRAPSTCKRGKFLFESRVFYTVAGDEMRSTTACSAPYRALTHRRGNGRMVRKTEVVVAAEVDERSPARHGHYAIAMLYERFDRRTSAPEMLPIKLRERCVERLPFHMLRAGLTALTKG